MESGNYTGISSGNHYTAVEGCNDSFLDMMAGKQNQKMSLKVKSLSYSKFHLQKVRCLYGMRKTLNIDKIIQM